MISIIAFVIIFIPFAGFFGTQAILSAGRAKDVKLPNLVGKTIEEAEQELKKAKLIIDTREEFSPDVEAGKIIYQNPPFADNYTVKENSTVEVIVSKGTEMTKMPKVIGMKFEEAENELKNSNLHNLFTISWKKSVLLRSCTRLTVYDIIAKRYAVREAWYV